MPLAPFASVDRSALRWLRSSEDHTGFDLLSGDTPLATLRWARRGGSLATADTAGGPWTLKRVGFLAPRLTLRAVGSESSQAVLRAHFRHHTIDVPEGRTYWLQRTSFLLPAWKVTTPRGEEVMHVEPVPEGRKLSGGAVLWEPAEDLPEALRLIVLAWYFIVLSWFEDEAVETLAPFEGPDAPMAPPSRS